MKIYALIKAGIVSNLIMWNGLTSYNPQGITKVDVTSRKDIQIGWSYDGSTFSAPAMTRTPVEKSISDVYKTFADFFTGTDLGQLAIAQDTGNLYVWMGKEWSLIGGPGVSIIKP